MVLTSYVFDKKRKNLKDAEKGGEYNPEATGMRRFYDEEGESLEEDEEEVLDSALACFLISSARSSSMRSFALTTLDCR